MGRFWRDENGATAMEYVMLSVFLGLVTYWGIRDAGTALYNKLLTIW
jgi:Flp pilus assembly pilin Flp